ncbi:MAG: serine/threonine-protein kinase, partial [Myxococcota bacterium]
MAVRTERYELGRELARGGMATVHLGRRLGAAGFERPVAVKRMHPHLLVDPEFVEMFVEEARLASHIHHPNVAQTLDVVLEDGELWLVLELVRGTSVSRLLTAAGRVPTDIACSIAHGALLGLDAAHDACDAAGRPLEIVHRDVSPQNVMVGVDGTARIIDFGVAKAAARSAVTRDGMIKGKIAYMAPEQLTSSPV